MAQFSKIEGLASDVQLKAGVAQRQGLLGYDLACVLEELGCEVAFIASDLNAAAEAVKHTDIDLLFVDASVALDPSLPIAAAAKSQGVPCIFIEDMHNSPPPGAGGLQLPLFMNDVADILQATAANVLRGIAEAEGFAVTEVAQKVAVNAAHPNDHTTTP